MNIIKHPVFFWCVAICNFIATTFVLKGCAYDRKKVSQNHKHDIPIRPPTNVKSIQRSQNCGLAAPETTRIKTIPDSIKAWREHTRLHSDLGSLILFAYLCQQSHFLYWLSFNVSKIRNSSFSFSENQRFRLLFLTNFKTSKIEVCTAVRCRMDLRTIFKNNVFKLWQHLNKRH